MNIKILTFVSVLIFSGAFCDSDEETRNLKVELNPDCDKQLNDTNVCIKYIFVHVTAESDKNDLHYLIDLIGKPSVLIARTSKDAKLMIDWNEMNGNGKNINFTVEPEYTFASVIQNFVMFNDTKDTSNYSDPANIHSIQFNPLNLTWDLVSLNKSDAGNEIMLEVNATNIKNGSFCLKFTVFGFKEHNENLPKLLHTPDSIQMDIIADKIQNKYYSSPRIAIELLMVSSENVTEGSYKMNRIRNLDDEFTPGIFDVYNLLSPRSDNDTRGAFIQYRPVCYTSRYRSVSYSTESRHGNVQNINSEEFEYSLPMNYFGLTTLHSHLKQGINITFGMPDDGFYSHTNYISFSMLLGLGAPAIEGLSMFVKIFSSVGLGVPLLVLIIGGIYVAVKRYRN